MLLIFRTRFDAEESALLSSCEDPDWKRWITDRTAQCTQESHLSCRLYFIDGFTDDIYALYVHSHNRLTRMLKCWGNLVTQTRTIMTDAVKRQLA